MQDALTERKKLARRIETSRHRADLSKEALSALVGINSATYAKLEKAESEPRVSVLKKIATYTNQCPVWLFCGDEPATDTSKE